MGPALAVVDAAPKLGVVLAAATAAATLVDRDPRRRALWMGMSLGLAAVILVGHIDDTDQFRSLNDRPLRFAGLCVAGTFTVILLAILFAGRPAAFPLLVVGVLPFRVPIEAAGQTANLLVPLYLVIAGGVGAYAWRARTVAPGLQARTGAPGLRADRAVSGGMGSPYLELALGAFLVLYALQATYSKDFDTALEQAVFFLIPFALLYALLREVRWSRGLVLGCVGVLAGLALVFCGIGFWEYARRELFWNPKVIASNQFESYFRVNSVFWDPNVYGRFLALVTLAVTSVMLWSSRNRVVLAAAVVLAVLWAGLVLTFSQSSFAALLAGLAVLAALRWDVRRAAVAAAAALFLGAGFVVLFQDTLKIDLGSSGGLNKVTSGRSDLIRGGVDLFAKRPLQGYGSGSFGRAYRLERKGNQQQAVSASHTMPVTVAAEQGLIGLAAYLAVLMAALWSLVGDSAWTAARGRAPPRAGGTVPAAGRSYRAARAALAAMFVALVVHTMVYAAFLEDPFTWVILAAGVSLAPQAQLGPVVRLAAPARAQPIPAAT
jgi:putative inorganic carbon (hco3(-)) transporter